MRESGASRKGTRASTKHACVFGDQTLGVPTADHERTQHILCARELTKRHEELHRGTVAAAAAHYAESAAEREGRVRGEFTLVLAPIGGEETARRAAEELESQQERAAAMVAERLAAGESVSRVAKEVAAELDLAKKEVYTTALRLKEELDGEAGGEAKD